MSTEENRSKRKFNFLDIVILLVIIAGVGFGVRKYQQASISTPISTKANRIEISYYIEEVPDYAAEAIQIGDPVKEEIQSANFGNVTDIQIDDSVSWARNDKGEFFESSRDGYASLNLKMEANGVMSQNGVTIDKSVYYIGQTITLHAGNSILKTGRISNLKVIEN